MIDKTNVSIDHTPGGVVKQMQIRGNAGVPMNHELLKTLVQPMRQEGLNKEECVEQLASIMDESKMALRMALVPFFAPPQDEEPPQSWYRLEGETTARHMISKDRRAEGIRAIPTKLTRMASVLVNGAAKTFSIGPSTIKAERVEQNSKTALQVLLAIYSLINQEPTTNIMHDGRWCTRFSGSMRKIHREMGLKKWGGSAGATIKRALHALQRPFTVMENDIAGTIRPVRHFTIDPTASPDKQLVVLLDSEISYTPEQKLKPIHYSMLRRISAQAMALKLSIDYVLGPDTKRTMGMKFETFFERVGALDPMRRTAKNLRRYVSHQRHRFARLAEKIDGRQMACGKVVRIWFNGSLIQARLST